MNEFVAVFPILRALQRDQSLEQEAFRVASELSALGRDIQLPGLLPQKYDARIEVLSHLDDRFRVPRTDRRLAYLGKRTMPGFRSWVVGKLSVSVDIDLTLWQPETGGGEKDPLGVDPRVLGRQICAEIIAREVFDLCCAANIAGLGAFEIGSVFVYLDGGLVDSRAEVVHDLGLARSYVARTAWPTLRSLPLAQVLGWVHKLKLTERVGDTPVSRAYNSWTYQFGPAGDTSPLDLFWALMGVEALYNDGREGVRDQVLRRSQLLLGERTSFKKDLSEMYRVRSAFVHGGLPFPARDFPYDAAPGYERFRSEVGNATAIAQAVLAGSMQELVYRDLGAIEFDTVIRGIPAG